MLLKFALSFALLPMTMLPALADNAQCYLEYRTHVYIDGPCEFTSREGGSFRIDDGGWIVDVGIDDNGWATAWWNADGFEEGTTRYSGGAARLHSSLGYLRRDASDAACWSNPEAKVCAW